LSLTPELQLQTARQVEAKSLSVRQTEALVRRLQEENEHPKEPKKVDPDIRRLQESLSEKIGANVDIKHSAKGKGKLIIQYSSLDELDGILDHIK